MKITSTYIIISLIVVFPPGHLMAQNNPKTEPPDTVMVPLKIRAAFDIAGPIIYLTDKNNMTAEGYISADLDEKKSLFFCGGYSDYKHDQYNYNYFTRGFFAKTGIEFNFLKPETARGKYWAGVGFHYGLSSFTDKISSLSQENYWGTTSLSIPSRSHWGHFIEASAGFRADFFANIAVGWSVSLRKLLYAGTDKEMRPIYFPGYGSGGKPYSTGLNYYLIMNFRYKTIRVLIHKKPPEEPQEQENQGQTPNTIIKQ